ncbi:tetratricopeptide repeat protein 12, partial [Plakobranchus ocellatus]
NSQTLYRTNDGLRMTETHTALHRYFTASVPSLSREERDVVAAALDMLAAACKDNETSQQQLLAVPGFPSRLLGLLEIRVKGQGRQLRSSCLALLYEISLTEAGRAALVEKMDLVRLITALFPLMKSTSSYNSTAAALLNNLALEKRTKILLRDKIDETILPAFENLLKSNQTSVNIVGVACSTATNLAADVKIRNKMAARSSLWQAVTLLVESTNKSGLTRILSDVLGLLVNMSTGVETSYLQSVCQTVTSTLNDVLIKSQQTLSEADEKGKTTEQGDTTANCDSEAGTQQEGQGKTTSLEREIITRALVVLSNILPVNSVSAMFMSERNRAERILEFAKNTESSMYKPALKCLTALTQSSHEVRVLVVDSKALSTLLNRLTDTDEAVVGNAALCLSHLTKDGESDRDSGSGSKQTLGARVCSRLTKTNIIQKLLTLARDGRKTALQGNCAILLGKLAQGDSRHLERLRELNGIQILHDCMKHVNY